MDGLAFSYMAVKERSDSSFELDIFLSDGDFYLEKVPCETISDWKTYQSAFDSFTMRECTVKFGDLTLDQKSQLEYFIQNHTMGEVQV